MDISMIQKSRLYTEAFLPGALTRLRNQAYVKIVGARNNDLALADVDKEQLVDGMRKFLADWETAGGVIDGGLRDAVRYNKVVVQAPSEIYATPFPLLLKCDRCEVIDFYDSRAKDEQVIDAIKRRISERGGRLYVCCKMRGCLGHMVQLPYVAVHRCGHMTPIHVPHTARRRTNIGFRDEGGSFFSNSFIDIETRETLAKALQEDCPGCRAAYPDADEKNKRGTPITGGDAYQSQLLQYIALSKNVGALVSRVYSQLKADGNAIAGVSADVAEALASTLLGLTGDRDFEAHLQQVFSSAGASEEDVVVIRAELEKLRRQRTKLEPLAADDDDFAGSLAGVLKNIASLERKLAQAEGQFKGVRALIPDDVTLLALIGQRRALEAVLLRHDVRARGVEQAIEETADAVAREALAQQWSVVRQRYGVASIAHIPDLLVVLAAVGYTRERKRPSLDASVPPVQLNGFEDANDDSLRGKSCVYAMSARTEALWIRLDPCRVLQWCVAHAGWESPGEPVMNDARAAHAHLLRHAPALTMPPGEVAAEARDGIRADSAPFHLLHSICHALLANARRHTGYDDKSLTEYLLPMDLSFVIYVTSVQNYTAGGLLTLFQHYLQNWFDDASRFAFNCAFDPICSDNGGACNGCLQTEIGCETFNHGLSRSYLHGGMLGRGGQASVSAGYWSDV
jgi:hypothetical protein